jgi:hypothetical protein
MKCFQEKDNDAEAIVDHWHFVTATVCARRENSTEAELSADSPQ